MKRAKKARSLAFVISGPSGSGKTTLLERLVRDRDLRGKLVRSVSFTTRPKRPGERNGRDYFFINEREFKEKLKQKKILEWTRYLGYYYATPSDFFRRQAHRGRHLGLCLDLRGASRLRRLYPGRAVTIFIAPPSVGTLRSRIRKRSCNTPPCEVTGRLRLAQTELKAARRYDHRVVNKDLGKTVSALKGIIRKELALRDKGAG